MRAPMRALRAGAAAVVASAALAASGPAVAQTPQEERARLEAVEAEIAEAFATLDAATEEEREAALAALEDALESLDAEIARLERRSREDWERMSDAARERLARTLHDLRVRRNRLSEAYGALSREADTLWDDMVEAARDGWEAVERAWDDTLDAIGGEDGAPR